MTTRKRPLGRGLDALIGSGARRRDGSVTESAADATPAQALPAGEGGGERLERLPLRQLTRGKYQPRRDIQPEALEELADSIRAQGVMQPIVVRQIGAERYEIIAGERRWPRFPASRAGDHSGVIREVSDEVALALALIENIQRENLNPVEEAMALSVYSTSSS
ncbi:ParB/RepB/Spo0J family partition protein [Salinicola tamaricis]|uniref:ParB/RepB/Spo0J family partition protein n=1 Tax=Salinicola tamaricis TaxID=1771309 RepID=UPI001F5DBF66|nr:ParB/RepB/Spo0J family partition protein [Salinicola tamaricis]